MIAIKKKKIRLDIFLCLLGLLVFGLIVPKAFAQTVTKTVCIQVGNAEGDSPCKTVPGNFVFYCQADPQWQVNGCQINMAGCGPTSAAEIISTFGVTIDPLQMDAIFRETRARSCGNHGSTIPNFLKGWLADNGFEYQAVALNSNGTLNLESAKGFLDNGYLILSSSSVFPCPPGGWCKIPGDTVNHIFAISGVDQANNTFDARDPINCTSQNPEEIAANVAKKNNFPLLYAYAIRKNNQ